MCEVLHNQPHVMKYSMVDLTSSLNNQYPQKKDALMNRMMHSNSQIISQSMLTQHNPSMSQ